MVGMGQIITPNQIPNLSLWLRADSLVVKDVNNNVSSWINCTGNGIDFNQTSPTYQPKWYNSGYCTPKPVIRFDGIDDFLNGGDNYDIDTNNRTVFIVGQANNAQYTFYSKGKLPINGVTNLFDFTGWGQGAVLRYYDTTINYTALTAQPNLNGTDIWCTTIDRNSHNRRVYRNGVLKDFEVASILGSWYHFDSQDSFLLGAHNGANGNGRLWQLDGDIAEMIIYNSALPDSQRNQVEQYLQNKYTPPTAYFVIYPDTTTPHHWFALNQATGTSPLSYNWNWGDGYSSNGAAPSWTYAIPGNYNICLTITDSTGCRANFCDSSTYIYKTDQDMISINVVNQLPNGILQATERVIFSLSPNPSTTSVTINIDETMLGSTATITDVTGRKVATAQLATRNLQLDTDNFPNGVYFVTVGNEKQSTTRKLVVSR